MIDKKGFVLRAVVMAVAGGVGAGAAGAQEHTATRFEATPYVSLFKDAYDIGADGNTGAMAGLRLGYVLGDRTRLVGSLAYGEAGDVAATPAGATDYRIYENRWVMTTAGAEYDVLQGRTALALGLQVGAGWRQLNATDVVGAPPADHLGGGGYAFYDVVVPGVTLRHRIARRATLELGVSDYMFDVLEASVDHSPAISLGVSIR